MVEIFTISPILEAMTIRLFGCGTAKLMTQIKIITGSCLNKHYIRIYWHLNNSESHQREHYQQSKNWHDHKLSKSDSSNSLPRNQCVSSLASFGQVSTFQLFNSSKQIRNNAIPNTSNNIGVNALEIVRQGSVITNFKKQPSVVKFLQSRK